MPPNNVPYVYRMDQALREANKGLDMILMGDLNKSLGKPCTKCKEDLETLLSDRDLVKMTDHFLPRRRYRGASSWTRSTKREGRRVTGRGEYILYTDRISFTNTGMQETRHGTEQSMILAVLRGEGALHNHC